MSKKLACMHNLHPGNQPATQQLQWNAHSPLQPPLKITINQPW
jgi:hypothetical protein